MGDITHFAFLLPAQPYNPIVNTIGPTVRQYANV